MTAKKLVQLTHWADASELIISQFGTLKWSEYLAREKERIEKSKGRVVEIRRGEREGRKYQIALFVNHVGAQIVNGNYVR